MLKMIRVKAFFMLCGVTLLLSLCQCSSESSNIANDAKVLTGYEENTYVSYRSFQNPDMTWGFTVFVNSVPYRHYDKVPYKSASRGFVSKKEADLVAEMFVNRLKNGDASPHLSKKSVDTLKITVD